MAKKIFFIFLFVMAIGTLISQINFIPDWEKIQGITIFVIFAIGLIIYVFYLVRLWKDNYRLKSKRWLRIIFVSVTLFALVTISFLFSILSVGQGFLGPVFEKKYKFANITVFQYVNSCFPPDNGCECNNYYSLVYVEDTYFPIMHLKKKVDFYIDKIEIEGNKMVIKASVECEKDKNKIIVVNLFNDE